MTPFQLLSAFLFGFGTAVIVFVLAAWSIEEKPKKDKKIVRRGDENYPPCVNVWLDEFEDVISR